MNLEQALLKEHSKRNTEFIANYICNNPSEIESLLTIFNANNSRLTQRAAWPLIYIVDLKKELLIPHVPFLISLLNKQMHVAVKRNVLRVLQLVPIPEDNYGQLIDLCFMFLADPKEPIAVKAFSIQIIYNACLIYPDLKNELILTIESNMINGSAGILSKGKNIMKLLNKI